MKFVGLTDEPAKRKQSHGTPYDWTQRTFENEKEARDWEKQMIDQGCKGGNGGPGWKYGYTYTITIFTRQ